jgi:2-polyprenyl-3-methyl-5-hydroxy-6-metoxy-1,4-benzoquinol methylase
LPELVSSVDTNIERNKRHYDVRLRSVSPESLVDKVRQLEVFLRDAIHTDTSWAAMYYGDFRARLEGARVLELGAGDGLNALVMAALGAHVVCVDVSEETPVIVLRAARSLGLLSRIEAQAGDFEQLSFESGSFDLVIGKAFLHHLTHEQEARYLHKTAVVLRPDGRARFTEPAVNSAWLDWVRWMIRVPGRPSRLNGPAFKAYRATDPHPVRDNSSEHFRKLASQFFDDVRIVPIGGLERFHRLLPEGRFDRRFRRAALRAERFLPLSVQMKIARGQTLLLASPRPAAR